MAHSEFEDPFFRALLAEAADLEWQAVEAEFLMQRREHGMPTGREPQDPRQQQLDRPRVVFSHPDDVDYWTRELRASEVSLRAALRDVGNRVDDVRRYLNTWPEGAAQ